MTTATLRRLLASAAIASIGAASAAAADADVATPVVRSISAKTGSFTTSETWNQVWKSNDTDPGVTLTAGRKDMGYASDGTGLDLREGTAFSSHYTITASDGWRVSSFSLTFRGNNAANPVTVTAAGQTLVSSTTEDITLTVTDISEYESASFTLAGKNQGISTREFTVTMVPVLPEPYTEVSIDMNAGDFTTSGVWKSLWRTSADSDKPVFLSSENGSTHGGASNMTVAADGVNFDLREGAAKTSDYNISTAGSWRVSGYEITFIGNDASNPVTVSGGGKSVVSSATEERTLLVENVAYGSKATFNLSGNNQGITTTSFKVHLTATSPEERGVCVFPYSGSIPYSTVYRIPTVAYVPAGPRAGRLVAVNDFRPCGADIGYGEVDLHISLSDDGGYTWTAPADPVDAQGRHVADGDGQGSPATSNENRDCGFGDPAIVADRETGALLMLGVCGRIPIGSATRAIPQGLATWTSNDGGETWTQWKDITEDILTQLDNNCEYGAVDGLFFTAGRMVQSRYVKVGSHYRVYVVGGGRSASRVDTQCWVFYTDDFGQSWHILGDPYKPALTTGGSEPKCEELPDGSVLFSGRVGGGRNFNVFTYTDYEKAKGFWDNAKFGKMVTGAASCNGDALIVPVADKNSGEGAYLLLQSIPLHPSSRVNVGVNYKVLSNGYDHFGSAEAVASDWDGSYQVTNLPSAYSSLVQLPDGKIGFIYEEDTFGRDYSEVYRIMTVEEITHGLYTYAADTDLATALRLTRELVDGKLAKAHKDYSSRTEHLENLDKAADLFKSSPSDDTYLAFNRALLAIINNTSVALDQVNTVTDTEESERLFDLLGRPISSPRRGQPYVSTATRRISVCAE